MALRAPVQARLGGAGGHLPERPAIERLAAKPGLRRPARGRHPLLKGGLSSLPATPRLYSQPAGRRLRLSLYHEAILAPLLTSARRSSNRSTRGGPASKTRSATVRSQGARRTRYIGLAKTDLQAILTAIAVNLRRTALWLMAERPATHATTWPDLPGPLQGVIFSISILKAGPTSERWTRCGANESPT